MTDDTEFDDPQLDSSSDVDPYFKGVVHGIVYAILLALASVGGWFVIFEVLL